tara:strand:- start:598 stop:5016 length:4419 start_codon:yes stop_codon:yes gene_type:complete
MSGEGFALLEELEAANFSATEIEEYQKKESLILQQGGFNETEIKDYWGIKEPKTSIAKEYWNNVTSSFKEPIKQVQKFDVKSPEVTEPHKKMDSILAEYQEGKIDKNKFDSLMNEQNEILQNLEKETKTEVLGISADDITSIPSNIKESAVGEKFEVAKYWERGFSQTIYNLAVQYHTDGELPQSFLEEEFADTGHIERAIQSFGTIIPDLPVYIAGGSLGYLLTRNKVGAAASAGFTAGTIRTMYTEALIRGDVDTFSEWWDIFIKEGMKAGGKEALLLGSAAFAGGFGNNPITSFVNMYAAFVGVGAALEQKMPTKDELINTALVLGGLQFGGGAISKTSQLITKTSNKTPLEIVEETIVDPKVREVVVSKNLEVDPKPIEVKETKPVETKEKITEKIEILEKELKTLETKQAKEVQTKDAKEVETKETKIIEEELLDIPEFLRKQVETKEGKKVETKDPRLVEIEENVKEINLELKKLDALDIEIKDSKTPIERLEEIKIEQQQIKTNIENINKTEIKPNERINEIKLEIVKEKEKLEIVEKETKEVEVKEIEKEVELNKDVQPKAELKTLQVKLQVAEKNNKKAEIKQIKKDIKLKQKEIKIAEKEIKEVKESKEIEDQVSFETVKDSKTFTNYVDAIAESFLDKLHPIFKAVKRVENKTTIKDVLNPYETFRIQPGLIGRAITFLEKGTINAKDLSINGKSWRAILESIKTEKEYKELALYTIAKRGLEKIKQGYEFKFTKEQSLEIVNKFKDKYDNIAKELTAYNKRLLDYMLEKGIVSKEVYDVIIEANKDYVPFARVIDSKGSKINDAITNPLKKMKKGKASDKKIIDPIETMYNNTVHFIALAERNAAFVKFIEMVEANAKDFPEIFQAKKKAKAIKVTKEELENVVTDISKISEKAAEGFTIFRRNGHIISESEIGFMRNGKMEVWEVGTELANTFKNFDSFQAGLVIKIMSQPSKLLRAGSTLAPEFFVRNITKDSLTAAIFSRANTIPILAQFRGLFHMINGKHFGGEMYQKWIKSGGLQSMVTSMDRTYFAKNVKQELLGSKPYNMLKSPLEMLRILSEGFETVTRLGEFSTVYRKAKKAGLSEKDAIERAGYEGRDVTIDFKKSGSQIQAWNLISAFFNARLQGYAKIFDGFKNRPIQTTAKISAYIVAPSILLWIKNHDDPRYQELPRWQKDLFWIFITDSGFVWRVPKPFELGIVFGTGTEKLLDYMYSKNPGKIEDFIKEMAKTNLKNLMPIPTAFVPLIEQKFNTSLFTNRPIVARDQEGILPEYQWTEYTSETAKLLGRGLRFILGDQTSWTSPARIDSVISNWTGTLGKHLVDFADKLLIANGVVKDPIKPADTLADMPIIKAFIVRNPSGGSEHIEDFYKNYLPIKKRLDTINSLEEPFEIQKQIKILNEKIGMDNVILLGYADALSMQRQLIDSVTKNPEIHPDEKRQLIDDTYRMMIMIAKQGNSIISK